MDGICGHLKFYFDNTSQVCLFSSVWQPHPGYFDILFTEFSSNLRTAVSFVTAYKCSKDFYSELLVVYLLFTKLNYNIYWNRCDRKQLY